MTTDADTSHEHIHVHCPSSWQLLPTHPTTTPTCTARRPEEQKEMQTSETDLAMDWGERHALFKPWTGVSRDAYRTSHHGGTSQSVTCPWWQVIKHYPNYVFVGVLQFNVPLDTLHRRLCQAITWLLLAKPTVTTAKWWQHKKRKQQFMKTFICEHKPSKTKAFLRHPARKWIGTILQFPGMHGTHKPPYSPSTEDGTPPPTMVLSRQLEVSQCNSHTCRHTQQNNVDNKENSIQRELLSSPHSCKYVIQFHRYCTANIKKTFIQHILNTEENKLMCV